MALNKSKKVTHHRTLIKTPSLWLSSFSFRKRNMSTASPCATQVRFFAISSVLILFLSTVYWALLSARLQQNNADQVANTMLFEHWSTFHQATFPLDHNFLIKWPVFIFIQLIGPTNTNFIAVTVVITVLTVGALAYLLYRIDRRPVVFGTLLLAMSSILLLVPPLPTASGLLPVNMAMLTTRNLEYILYIIGLIFIIRSKKLLSFSFIGGVSCLALLFASDRLFLFLSLGGSLLAFVAYSVARVRANRKLIMTWLLASVVASLLAILIISLINHSGLTDIVSSGNSGPYSLVHTFRKFIVGCLFAVLGILTNFGANPVFDTGVVAHFFVTARAHLADIGVISFITNFLLFCFSLFASLSLLARSIKKQPPLNEREIEAPQQLSLLLIWSTLMAVAAFILTEHYYASDARYLSIAFFALFISAASFLRQRDIISKRVAMLLSGLLLISIGAGLHITWDIYKTDQSALSDIAQRNSLVSAALSSHPVSLLIGDYWRVLPIKTLTPRSLTVMPMSNCTQPLEILSSEAWRPNLSHRSFAYLLSLDKGVTTFPSCTIQQAVQNYGYPNKTILIKGSYSRPRELLLFYDAGLHHKKVLLSSNYKLRTITPIDRSQLPKTLCSKTIVNIVAHQDDDLLFMNPDLSHSINDGNCIRTIYITAGDAGLGKLYWLQRERGSENAYDYMLQLPNDIWVYRTIKLSDHSYVTIANPRKNHKVYLVFFRLPDGNLNGNGFLAENHESLAKLESGKINLIHSVDGQSFYTSNDLIVALQDLLQIFQPTEIHTMATYNLNLQYPDHSDHLAAGRYTEKAYQQTANLTVPLRFYYGYPIRSLPSNINSDDLSIKTAVFLAYTKYAQDTGCNTSVSCLRLNTYGSYLRRQYSYLQP